jgi:tetratricopeptide (TPR) repeat protein
VQKSLKDLDAVEINLRKAVALNPGLVTPYCNLKLILKGQNKQDEAFSCLEEALIIDPNYHTAQHYLNSMT